MDIPKRKIEKPATLEEAYQLIESMRSTATRSFFRFLREGNLDGVKEQYRIGADIFAREERTDLTCLEVVADEKTRLYAEKKVSKNVDGENNVEDTIKVDPEAVKKDIRERVARLEKVSEWLRLQGADPSMMFYLMAINGDEAGIVRSREYCLINACNEDGLTAVDMALIGGKFEEARLLHRHGGAPNPRWKANKQLSSAIHYFCDPFEGASPKQIKLIVEAIEAGLSPETRVIIPSPSSGGDYDTSCSLYAVAVRYAKYDVLEACLKNGADANAVLSWTQEIDGPWGEHYVMSNIQATPWGALSRHNNMKDELRQKFCELLLRYGAKIDEE